MPLHWQISLRVSSAFKNVGPLAINKTRAQVARCEHKFRENDERQTCHKRDSLS
jgi:hypothetical protein